VSHLLSPQEAIGTCPEVKFSRAWMELQRFIGATQRWQDGSVGERFAGGHILRVV